MSQVSQQIVDLAPPDLDVVGVAVRVPRCDETPLREGARSVSWLPSIRGMRPALRRSSVRQRWPRISAVTDWKPPASMRPRACSALAPAGLDVAW